MSDDFLMMKDINKSFSGVQILDNVSLEVKKGEVYALLGENGAGKSTLMNILGGVLQPDEGEIFIENEKIDMKNPRVSQLHGVSFIHQELNVISDLKVYESVFLGSEIRNKFGFLKVDEMCQKTTKILNDLNVKISPHTYIRDLDTSYKQLVEISKMLLHNSKLIIMDEPTTALAEHEINRLFALIKKLQQSGVSIIYISHKLNEIQKICDRFTVLRDGKVVGKDQIENADSDKITQLMVGKSISNDRIVKNYSGGEEVLKVEKLTSPGSFKDINFTVKKGEIIGFTGLVGDGRSELFESIFGFRNNYTGNIKVNGKTAKIKHPSDAIRNGIGLVPKDRKENGIIKDMNVYHNMTLSSLKYFKKNGFINKQKERVKFKSYKKDLNIKVHNPNKTIDRLSGGNQQKVIIAKWLELNTDIIIFDNPTQGVDVGAKEEIYQEILKLAQMGNSIIILSSEATEIMKICHKINVMNKGEIVAQFLGDEATEDNIMSYATGAKSNKKQKESVNIG